MNKYLKLMPLMVMPLVLAAGCAGSKNTIVIYSANEDYRIAMFQDEFNKEFPQYNVVMQSLSTGNLVSRLQSEGKRTNADIVVGFEIANHEMVVAQNPDLFADLSDYDTSKYLDSVLTYKERHNKYHIFDREAGCIIINTKVLKDKGLSEPESYKDLLKPEYKNLIIMPNPKSSGTGYYFYKNLTNTLGLEKGLEYFESLSQNVKEFSTSGSGPVKSCDRGETAIGLGMTFQAAKYVTDNPDLKIKYFKEGSPYTYFTMGVINGRFEKEGVKEVYDFIYNDLTFKDKALFAPDKIYKDEYQPECQLENFPTDITYAEMGDIYDYEYKQELLDNWKW